MCPGSVHFGDLGFGSGVALIEVLERCQACKCVVGTECVVELREGIDERVELIECVGQFVDAVELVAPGCVVALDMSIEVGPAGRGDVHGYFSPFCLGLELGHELRSAVDLDAVEAEGQAFYQFIEKVLGVSGCGTAPAAIRILAHCHHLTVPGLGTVELAPEWMGEAMPGGLYPPAYEWLSRSPCIPARHDEDIEVQIARECEARGLPRPLDTKPIGNAVLLATGEALSAGDFVLRRANGKAPPRRAEPCFLRIIFPEPVAGPLCFGYGSHFGLGQLMPLAS